MNEKRKIILVCAETDGQASLKTKSIIEEHLKTLLPVLADHTLLHISTSMAKVMIFLSEKERADSKKRMAALESEWEAIIALPGWEKSTKARELMKRAIENNLPIFCPTSSKDTDFLNEVKGWAESYPVPI